MTADLYDSVNPNAIPADAQAVAGYDDGPESEWPADGWRRFSELPVRHITVLANPASDTFDAETGNASNDEVAGAVAGRLADGLASWVYVNQDNYQDMTRALRTKSLRWSEASVWPAPGVYLWAADPSGNIAAGTWRPEVAPVAVQDRSEGAYDVSTLAVTLAAPGGQQGPNPTQSGGGTVTVTVPELRSEGSGPYHQPHGPVAAVQRLVGVAADGLFGPATDAAVRAAQGRDGITVDGIVGPVTWAKLLGV